jgi:putative transposase
VRRQFDADAPNRLWVADMTYVPTWAGFIYLAVVLDAWSRRIVGGAIGETMTAELVLSALNMALQQRKCELIDRRSWQTKTEARLALFTWIEGWYNPRRRHSALSYLSPMTFELQQAQQSPQRGGHALTTDPPKKPTLKPTPAAEKS